MTSAVLERSRELAATRHAAAARRYDELVALLASGGDAAPEDILDVLAAADRSGEDLQADLARIEAKAACKVDADKLPGLTQQLAKLDAERAAIEAEQKAALLAFGRRLASVDGHLASVRAQAAAAEQARDKLARGLFDSPAQKATASELAKAISRLSPDRMAIEDELRRARNQVAAYEAAVQQAIKQGQPRADVAEAQEMLAGAKRKVADLEHRLRPITAELEQIGRRQAALNAERLA